MNPRTRRRRASFLPRPARTSAVTVMSFLTSSPHQGCGKSDQCFHIVRGLPSSETLTASKDRAITGAAQNDIPSRDGGGAFSNKQNTNRSLFVNRLHRRRQQLSDRQRPHLCRPPGLLRKRNCIRQGAS